MITVEEYLKGRDKQYPTEFTVDLRINAQETVQKINDVLDIFGEERRITSGWRPAAVNAATPGAAKFSKHTTCQAGDIEDDEGDLDAWCFEHPKTLEEIGLWQEHPASTKGWCHLQIVQYKSWVPGKPRWFYP